MSFGDLPQLDASYGLPSGLLQAICTIESGCNPNAGTNSAGASGPFQFLPSTFAQFNNNPSAVFNFDASAMAAGQYLQQLLGLPQVGGNVYAAAASYNSGPGSLNAPAGSYSYRHALAIQALAQTGDTAGLPAETQSYVAKLQQLLGGGVANVSGSSSAASGATASAGVLGGAASAAVGTVTGWLGSIAARFGIFVVGAFLLLGAILLFSKQQT